MRLVTATLLALTSLLGFACSSAGSSTNPSVEDAGGSADALDDPAPVFTNEERAKLKSLRYDPAPPKPDVSNAYGDVPLARAFGQKLFFDSSLSGPLLEGDNDGATGSLGVHGEAGKVSCAGCHLPQGGFVDTRSRGKQISLGALWGSRKAPTLLESGFVQLFNWGGERDSMWRQAIGVMENERELNSGRLFVAEQIHRYHRSEYEAIFGPMPPLDDEKRFPQLAPSNAGCVEKTVATGTTYVCRGKPGDHADYDAMTPADQEAVTRVTVNTAKAIAAYVRLLRCGAGRFDAWLDGDASALSRAEERGAALFVGKAKCVQCHSGPNLTDGGFHNVGLRPQVVAVAFVDKDDPGAKAGLAGALVDPLNVKGMYSDGDDGRLPASVSDSMLGAFRTPTLRCVASHPSFMHTGHFAQLSEVVAFFRKGGDAPGGYLGHGELSAIELSAREERDLVAFLQALDGPGPEAGLLAPP